jgi:hypothetical protein
MTFRDDSDSFTRRIYLPIYVRAHVPPTNRKQGRHLPNPQQPASDYSLIFDTETKTDGAQRLRFGVWQLRKGNELVEVGIFYNPKVVTGEERSQLHRYAKKHKMKLLKVGAFINDVFYDQAYELRANIVGLNLPYDLSRIAARYGSARGKRMRGGFTFQLSDSPWKPRIQIRHLSARAALKQFTKPRRQFSARSMRNRGLAVKPRRGSFIDLRTTAAALTSRSFSLASLADFLKTPHRKLHTEEHGQKLTESYIDYAVRDVQVTWECYVALRKKFAAHGLKKTLLSQILSEASLGKAYLTEMEIASLAMTQPGFPDPLKGYIMCSYYGGRSEVHIRRVPVRVLYCDFLSMYPTVCTLMRLWRFVIAKEVKWRDSTAEIISFLENVSLDDLQRTETWGDLTTIVEVEPDDNILPARAKYDGDPQAKIGLNALKSKKPLWFTLADCIAAKLLGRPLKVTRAITFTSGEVQDRLKPVAILGNPDYVIDPTKDDFYKHLIDLRTAIKRQLKSAKDQARVQLETAQKFLKILANATSYGIFIELNVSESDEPETRLCYGPGGKPFRISTTKIEEPGRYFHPLLATLITGAARLMLAISETLAIKAGLDWAFCDTDSMALAKPDEMDDAAFYKAAQSVRDWFTPLNPYEHKEPLFKIEDANYVLRSGKITDKLAPLFCLAISDKRYVLYNMGRDGRPVIRKASAHGLGHLIAPYGEDDAPASIPRPADKLDRIGVERWQYDLWYQIIMATLEGHPDSVDLNYHPALNDSAASRYSATTPALLKWFRKYNESVPAEKQVWPFNFLLAYQVSPHRFAEHCASAGLTKLPLPKPVSPFDTDINRAVKKCFDRDDRETGNQVSPDLLMTYKEALGTYQLHPESKFYNGDAFDRGTTERQSINAVAVVCIGKEANRWEEQYYLGLNLDAQIVYGIAPPDPKQLRREFKLALAKCAIGQREIAKRTGLSRTTVAMLLAGKPVRNTDEIMHRVLTVLQDAEREAEYDRHERGRASVR